MWIDNSVRYILCREVPELLSCYTRVHPEIIMDWRVSDSARAANDIIYECTP